MKNNRIMFSLLCLIVITAVFLGGCQPKGKDDSISAAAALKAEPVAASSSPLSPKVIASKTEDGKNYYLIDAGYIKNMLVSTLFDPLHYPGMGVLTLSRTDITERTVAESLTKGVSESVTVSDSESETKSLEAGYRKEFPVGDFSAKISISRTFSDEKSKTIGKSTETSVSKVQSYAKQETLSFELGRGDPAGWYRYVLYAVSDVYFIITTSPDRQILLGWETVVCARDDSYLPHLEYSSTGKFDNSPESGKINFPDDFYKKLDPISAPAASDAEIITTSFSAYVWCENSNVGLATFSVTGIKVKYGGAYYVYGNAYYRGNLGGSRYNDVDQLYLKNSNRKILMGGTLHWWGTVDESAEAGTAVWNKFDGFNKNEACYIPDDTDEDFAANEETSMSFTDICVELVETVPSFSNAPEIVETAFTADIYCESAFRGKLNFSVIGIKAKYNGNYYVMGNAFHTGNPGSSRFNDVAEVHLKNSSRNILFGGTMLWHGSRGDFDESGIAGFNKDGGWDSPNISYMVENPTKDFTGDESTKISITGICVRLGATDADAAAVPEIATSSFTASLYCESSFSGSANFSVIGIKVKYGTTDYIYGNAFFSDVPGGKRFNDVSRFSLRNTGKLILLGGTLHWYGSYNDTEESAVVGFVKGGGSPSAETVYIAENATRDFAAEERYQISITGILVQA
ncbi:MAG: hypothetical protein LBP62_02620 [Clostridiales bacterium]|jgi:hypothetical protein|nr:hypothetical protein [Clostridiales bacterium]